eukprot:COSAG02_NODE_56495_length_285_cov_0.833333_1_plen_53_part_01
MCEWPVTLLDVSNCLHNAPHAIQLAGHKVFALKLGCNHWAIVVRPWHVVYISF